MNFFKDYRYEVVYSMGENKISDKKITIKIGKRVRLIKTDDIV